MRPALLQLGWLAALVLGACGDPALKAAGDSCFASSECADGLTCDFGQDPPVCAGMQTAQPDAAPVPDAPPDQPDAAPVPDAPPGTPDAAPVPDAPPSPPDAAEPPDAPPAPPDAAETPDADLTPDAT
jgi:hypothetical protein